jgi:signal transduction histidine kinase
VTHVPLLALEVHLEPDIVLARQRARQIAGLLGFSHLDQTRIATATSEIARNAVQYAGGGRVEFLVESGPKAAMLIRVRERGPGIRDLQAILDGQYISSTGLGLGIVGAKRLMDRFAIESGPAGGETVSMAKILPHRTGATGPQEIARISAELARRPPQGLLEELQQQNQELLNTLQELRDRQAELSQLHSRELDETNRGVVALYTELDENTNALKRLSDLKSRFLSEMSHEFRSPLNSIRSLTTLLIRRTDGGLTPEQEKQVQLIRKSAEGLSILVDDLLDLAKVEAGKAAIRVAKFSVAELFESLQGTIRPTIDASSVRLVFEASSGLSPLQTDEGKLTQVLRNFLSNAVKFTVRGEIRLAARPGPGDTIIFAVADTGIGIAPEDLPRIFDEFGQIENPLQARSKGTGLGMSLARKLAELLGGGVAVESEPGSGSTFTVSIPRIYRAPGEPVPSSGDAAPSSQGGVTRRTSPTRALIVDDQEEERYLLRVLLLSFGAFDLIEAPSGEEAVRLAIDRRPDVILLDLGLPDITGFQVLDRLKSDDRTRGIPVIIHTARILDTTELRLLEGRVVSVMDKAPRSQEVGAEQLRGSLQGLGLEPSAAGAGGP